MKETVRSISFTEDELSWIKHILSKFIVNYRIYEKNPDLDKKLGKIIKKCSECHNLILYEDKLTEGIKTRILED